MYVCVCACVCVCVIKTKYIFTLNLTLYTYICIPTAVLSLHVYLNNVKDIAWFSCDSRFYYTA